MKKLEIIKATKNAFADYDAAKARFYFFTFLDLAGFFS